MLQWSVSKTNSPQGAKQSLFPLCPYVQGTLKVLICKVYTNIQLQKVVRLLPKCLHTKSENLKLLRIQMAMFSISSPFTS